MPAIVKSIILNNEKIQYTLEYKNVKNINLRIKSNGEIFVSASSFVPINTIEKFLILKKEFILKSLKRFENKKNLQLTQYFSFEELVKTTFDSANEIYPYFKNKGINFPEIKFRKMSACWGSCHYKDGFIIFNKFLMFVPKKCVHFIVCHEFTHFLVPNHSKKFYDELSKICPNHKELKAEINKIFIPKGEHNENTTFKSL